MSTPSPQLSIERLAAVLPTPPVVGDVERQALEGLRRREGAGKEMLGWLDLPLRAREECGAILDCASRLREDLDHLVVVGIGGSYLGARALLEALLPADGPKIHFAGHHLEARAYSRLAEELKGQRWGINIISKSGTTTEPAVAFRLLRQQLEAEVGRVEAARRIVATTDAEHGALLSTAQEEGYQRFVVPSDVGGRFSVLSPVGLLPLAVAGVDIDSLLSGAAVERTRCLEGPIAECTALHYAMIRRELYLQGYAIELLANFAPSLHQLAEWWKQLFGESEGKDGRGLWPASADYTTDLHSLGQYLQDGRRILFETFLHVEAPEGGPSVPAVGGGEDGLAYLEGRSLVEINEAALEAVADAHRDGGVPNLTLRIGKADEAHLGSLLYFFEIAVALGGRFLNVNAFDQPGVEAYKRNLFARLGKPGH